MPKWIFIFSIVAVIAVGGITYYFFPKQPHEEAITAVNHSVIAQTGNPLLKVSKSELNRWFPAYCGADMFIASPPKQHDIEIYVNEILKRVEVTTGIKLSRNDVLDPAVKKHWLEVMKGK